MAQTFFTTEYPHHSNGEVKCKKVQKKSQFSTNISLYLRNSTRYDHSHNGMRIGNGTQALEWYHLQ